MSLGKPGLLIKGMKRLSFTRQIQMLDTHDLTILEFDNLFAAMLVPNVTLSYPAGIAESEKQGPNGLYFRHENDLI